MCLNAFKSLFSDNLILLNYITLKGLMVLLRFFYNINSSPMMLFTNVAGLILHEGNKGDLPLCPLVISLVPLKCSSANLQFHHKVPFNKKKMPWCPCPFQKQSIQPLIWIIYQRYTLPLNATHSNIWSWL